MKKFLFFAFVALALTSCKDDCDHKVGCPPPEEDWIVGSWYEEEENEETRYSESGTWYDKYSNVRMSNETEGRWEKDDENHRLTHYYNFMGQSQVSDWTISNQNELSFTISSSTVASHILEKIVETYTMSVGQTQQIQFSTNYPTYSIQSYSSKNERIASVSNEGVITTNGEKGTAYIKIATNKGNAWVKVVVGDECLDLWYDYISLIGQSYSQMCSVLGNPHQNDGEQGYFYAMEYHNIIQQVSIWLNQRTRKVDTFNLKLKEGVPSEVVLTYMESRYYKYKEIGKSVQFLNYGTFESSTVIIEYNQETGVIIIVDKDSYINLWPDFTKYFGIDKVGVRKAADEQKLTFAFDSYTYSQYGSDYYQDEYGEFVNLFGFVYNEHGQMFEYWAYVYENTDLLLIADNIGSKYFYDEEETIQGHLIWYNEKRTIRVELNAVERCIIYTDTTLDGLPKWPDYTSAFGMTLEELAATYGELLLGIYPYYYISNDYIESVFFSVDDNTGKTTAFQLTLKEGFSIDEINEYLSSKYILFGVNDTKTMFGYRDGETSETSKLQVIFNAERGTIIYYDMENYGKSNPSTRKQIRLDDTFDVPTP